MEAQAVFFSTCGRMPGGGGSGWNFAVPSLYRSRRPPCTLSNETGRFLLVFPYAVVGDGVFDSIRKTLNHESYQSLRGADERAKKCYFLQISNQDNRESS